MRSVGVQPTISNNLNFKNISIGFGFKKYFLLKTKREVDLKLKKILKLNGPIFLHKNKSWNPFEIGKTK